MSTALMAVDQGTRVFPAQGEWNVIKEQAAIFIKSGLLPAHIKTPEAAIAIMIKGRELGIQPMYALSNIIVVQGKPSANAELMLALIYRDHGDSAVQFDVSTPALCTISYKRRTWPARKTHSFTIEEAKAAQLIKQGPWQQYPAAMLRARCISAVARMAFPDSIGGMYTAEELGATVNVTSDGAVEVIGAVEDNPHQADTLTGEITRPKRKELADGERAPDKWLTQLADLRTQYLSLVPDATVYIPDPLSVAEAKRLKAWLTEQIASALDAGNSEDDGALDGVI